MKNVVLLGESHFAYKNGITQGILEGGCNCFNLSLGGTPSLQNLYELIRNKKLLENADLIITGSNTHDIAQYNCVDLFPKSYQVIHWLYKELYFLNKKIICFIAPTPQKWLNKNCTKYVNTLHKNLAIKYGFNIIDMNERHLKSSYGLIQRDEAHDFDFIMRELGKNIANNIENFSFPKKLNITNDNPKFYFYPIEKANNLNLTQFKSKQSWLCNEKVYCLNASETIYFNQDAYGLNLLGIHLWNESGFCKLKIKNPKANDFNLDLDIGPFSCFCNMHHRQFKIHYDTEISNEGTQNINLISFFLVSAEGNYHTEKIDFKALTYENIAIPKEYDCNHLIPPIEFYKEIIDEYCAVMNPIPQTSLAKARIQSHLSYKLGQALIDNSKSLWGYLRMPFVLSYIKDKHEFEQKAYKTKIKEHPHLALPSLESYPDYKAALKEKECFTYKLGQAFIKASKTWYRGGGIEIYLQRCA